MTVALRTPKKGEEAAAGSRYYRVPTSAVVAEAEEGAEVLRGGATVAHSAREFEAAEPGYTVVAVRPWLAITAWNLDGFSLDRDRQR
jgi:hypothetical protein